jgi:hypothetical protein
MIKSNKNVLKHISDWLISYKKSSQAKCFVVYFDSTRHSTLLIHLCFLAAVPVYIVTTNDSKASENNNNYKFLISLFGDKINPIHVFYDSLDAPKNPSYTHSIADLYSGIILGSIDKTFGLYLRKYKKHQEYTSDIFPLYDLFYSDIVKISSELFANVDFNDSADENKVRLIEWSIMNNIRTSIITNAELPEKSKHWYMYNYNQKVIISEMYQRDKLTMHKKIQKPYCSIYSNPLLVLDVFG